MTFRRGPDALCMDCETSFAAFRPGVGNLLRWRCSSCGGRLRVHITCRNCGENVERTTGFRGVYGRFFCPSNCEHCGEKLGLPNNMPGSFGVRGSFFGQSERRLLSRASLRGRLTCVILIYCMTTGFIGLTIGMMIGGCLSGVLYVAGFDGFEILGLDAGRWLAALILFFCAIFAAAGVWYGWRHIDVEISQEDPRLLN